MPINFRRKWPLVLFHANLSMFIFINKIKDTNKRLLLTIISIILLRTTCSQTDHSLFISTHFRDIPNYLLVGFLINSAREEHHYKIKMALLLLSEYEAYWKQ